MKPKIDFLSISYPPDSTINFSDILKAVFESTPKINPHHDFIYAENVAGLVLVKFHNALQIQLEPDFFRRNQAMEEAQKIFAMIKKENKVKIARIDVCVDFAGEDVEDLFPRKYAHSRFFKNSTNWEPGIIGNPATFINFRNRHAKIRLYNRVARIQKLIAEKKVKPHHLEVLRDFGEIGLTRFEVELRANYALYADSIFESCESCDELAEQALGNFLRENPFLDENEELHPTWKRLTNKSLMKKKGRLKEKPPKNKRNMEIKNAELERTESFLRNKFNRWGFSDLEAFKYLLKTFDLIKGVDYFPALDLALSGETEPEVRSYNQLRAELLYYELKSGPRPGRGPKGQAA